MEKIEQKILTYLKKNFGQKIFSRVAHLDPKVSDVYGFNSIQILVQQQGNIIKYQPIFKNGKRQVEK